MIQSGQAQGLEDAYEQAIWLNPETRKIVLEEQEKGKLAEAQKAVKKAKKTAGTQVKSKGGTGSKPTKKKTMEETMSETYDRANAS